MPFNIPKRLRQMRGFTMVELMIVIAIIGIIAVAVLSAINPIEQINKGRDTRTRSDASELLNAMERMYATDEAYPFYAAGDTWQVDVNTTDAALGMTAAEIATALVTQSELKAGFDTRVVDGDTTDENALQVITGDDASELYVCFLPSSNQFRREANTKCLNDAATYGNIICNTAVANAAAIQTVEGNLICMP